jgi:RNA polymerase primary sigma factor
MRKIQNQDLAGLLTQARFAPPRQRKKQVDNAERLLDIIEQGKEYPYEFVCFKITGYRPDTAGSRLIKAETLADDLRVFIWKLSGQVAPPASEQIEPLYTTKHLAKKLGVSTKTIDRWRKRGLKFRKYVYQDKRKRLGFTQPAVDKFFSDNPSLAAKAGRFRRLSRGQKQQIIDEAANLSAQTNISRGKIIQKIAAQTGVAQETIRCILQNSQKINPQKAQLLRPVVGHLNPSQAAQVDVLFKQGIDVKEIMARFDRSKSAIYRILKQRRTQKTLSRKIEYIHSEEFTRPDAEEKILSGSITPKQTASRLHGETAAPKPGSLSEYLEGMKNTPVLNRQQEENLFRRYNYLKYLAFTTREKIRSGKVSSRRLNEIERFLEEAQAIRKIIIEANLRLVVSIANRHTITGANVADLVSEGNVSLMQAVEKFDYSKGFRFSTYASWAITKDFAHKMPGRRTNVETTAAATDESLQESKGPSIHRAGVAELERARNDLIEVIKNNLEPREQYIIINHFGLVGTLVKKNKQTLKQIGDELGLSKERVRQIELIGLQKLRQSLSPEQFDLLRG